MISIISAFGGQHIQDALYKVSLVLIPTTVTAVIMGYIRSEKSVPLAFVFCIGYIIFKAVIFLKGG